MAVLLWTVVPLALLHLVLWRFGRELFRFHLIVDLILTVVIGPALVIGGDLNPVRVLEETRPFAEWRFSSATQDQPTQSDVVLQFHPWWDEARQQLGQGRLPMVSDHLGGGMPLMAHGQIGLWAPVMLPVWVLGPERGTTVMAFWKIELAALGAFLMLRIGWRLRWSAAALGGVLWAGGAFHVAWLLVPLSWVGAALPWLWWATAAVLRRRIWGVAPVCLGVAFGWLLGCGLHPEMATVVVGSCLMAGAVFRPNRWPRLALAMAVAVPLAMVLAWPTLTSIGSSAKAQEFRDARPNMTPISNDLRETAVRQMLVPMSNGRPGRGDWRGPYPYAAAATGVGGAALVLIAAGGIRRRNRRLMWAALAGLAVAAVLAYRVPPLDALLVRLPPFDRMTLPRFAILAPWALSLLAAMSLDGWERGLKRCRLWPLGAVVLIVAAAVTGRPWELADADALLVALTVATAAAAVVLLLRPGAFVLLVAVELALYSIGVNPAADASDRLPLPPMMQELSRLSDRSPGRILGLGGVVPPNMAARFGIADLRAYDPVRPAPYAEMMARMGESRRVLGGPLRRAPAVLCGGWSVRYLVTPPNARPTGWVLEWGDRSGKIWSNPHWLPEVRLVGRAEALSDERGWRVLFSGRLDMAREAVLPDGAPRVAATEVRLMDLAADSSRIRARVRCDGPCLLVVARPWDPGWRARVDDDPADVERANLAGLGVVSPAGEHTVELVYRPWSFR